MHRNRKPFLLIHCVIFCAFVVSRGFTNGQEEPWFEKRKTITWTVGWSSDDKFLAVGNDAGELSVYETRQWEKLKSWKTPATTITRVEWNPKFPVLAVAATWYEGAPSVPQLYDMANDQIIASLSKEYSGRGVSWSPDGARVAYAGADGSIGIFTKDGKLQRELSFKNVNPFFDVHWHPLEELILAVEEEIFLIDPLGDSLVAKISSGSLNKGILCCRWHPSGKFFVTGDYGHESEGGEPSYLRFWRKDGSPISLIKEGKAEYRNVRWDGEGRYLAAASDRILLFDSAAKLVKVIRAGTENIWGVDWSNDGMRIAASDQDGVIRIFDREGKLITSFRQ